MAKLDIIATVVQQCADQVLSDLQQLDTEMRSQLEWSDVQMLQSILILLETV